MSAAISRTRGRIGPLLLTLTAVVSPALAGPLTPEEALKTFELADPNLEIELVASEPAIEDPVAMAFDEYNRLYVVEMRGFQQGEDAKGIPGVGRVSRLEDRDGDGRYETSTVYADGMYYPTAVVPAYGGIVVGCSPDILWFKDTDGDGKADERRVLWTGFGTGNHEQLVNSFQWGIDGWIYAASGGSGGQVRPGDQPNAKPISIGSRNFRFRISPDGRPVAFETLSGGGQYGLTCDDAGRWLTCSNARHIIQIILPESYLARNPYLAVSQVAADVSDHGPAAKIARISPFEEWRVVRTKQRAAQADRKYPASELVPGGYFTAAVGIYIYSGDLLPDCDGQAFTCDAANNLIHRDRLDGSRVQLLATRVDGEDKEFLASKDPWFRPVTTSTGPDGALYVIDMYREIIETPVSIPPDILKTIDMSSGHNMGRIYRIRPRRTANVQERSTELPRLHALSSAELVGMLASRNGWIRGTAQRLLLERNDPHAVAPLEQALSSESTTQRLYALRTLDEMGELSVEHLVAALRDRDEAVRVNALRIAEPLLETPDRRASQRRTRAVTQLTDRTRRALTELVLSLEADPSALVRFQLALTIGSIDAAAALTAIQRLAARDIHDPWMRSALLTASPNRAAGVFEMCFGESARGVIPQSPAAVAFARDLMSIVGARHDARELAAVVDVIGRDAGKPWWRPAALDGLAQGIRRSGAGRELLLREDAAIARIRDGLLALLASPDTATRQAARRLAAEFSWPDSPALSERLAAELEIAANLEAPEKERIGAIAFAGSAPLEKISGPLLDLLRADEAIPVQRAAIAALARSGSPEAARMLLDKSRWLAYTPALRDAVIDALLAREECLPVLLDAIESGVVPAWAIDSARRERLVKSHVASIRERAARVFTPQTSAERLAIFERYRPVVAAGGDRDRGKVVFEANCAACHRLEGIGSAVGPDLKTVQERDPVQLLGDILNPSAAITAGYSYYLIETVDGESLSGVVANESATAITLRQREGVETTVLRSNIESIYASSLSMMPEELEKTITPEQMADLIAFLKSAR